MQRLYHESQEGKLCGVHALNTLLQGPFFSEVDLSQIAGDLDAMERNFMAEGGIDSAEFLKFAAEESRNVAADGNFSIQVLSKALEVWALQLVNLQSPDAAQAASAPHLEEAFICNLDEHWFTLRRIGGDWWNFNSINPAPQPLGSIYLETFLQTLREQGYSIFVVKGVFPEGWKSHSDDSGAPGRWFTPAEAREANQRGDKIRSEAMSGAANADLAAALAASLSDAYTSAGGGGGGGNQQGGAAAGAVAAPGRRLQDEDADLAAAIAASLGAAPDHAASSSSSHAAGPAAEPAPAPPPVTCPREIPEEPPPGAGALEIALRLPDGSRLQRRFRISETVGTITDYLLSQGVDMSKHQLGTVYPRRVLSDLSYTLPEAKLGNQETLTVELKR